jgi:hypothetical protein
MREASQAIEDPIRKPTIKDVMKPSIGYFLGMNHASKNEWSQKLDFIKIFFIFGNKNRRPRGFFRPGAGNFYPKD